MALRPIRRPVNSSIDLRQELDKLLSKWGINCYLQRRLEDPTISADPKNPSKFWPYAVPDNPRHSFYEDKLEKYTVRYTYAGRKTTLAGILEERQEGLVHTVNRVYYFPWYATPAEDDRIYQPDERYDPPFETYIIDYAQPFTGQNGEVVFWEVGCTRENPN